jgi:hypothetical protein
MQSIAADSKQKQLCSHLKTFPLPSHNHISFHRHFLLQVIRRILERETGTPFPIGSPVDTSAISSIRMGTFLRSSLHAPFPF